MIPTLLHVQEVAGRLFPFRYTETWDNSGIQIGDFTKKISSIAFSLNASIEALDFAAEKQCDLLISHHPILINPIKQILASDHIGKIIFMAVKTNVDVMSLHTNLDAAQGGLNDFLSEKLALRNIVVPIDAPCARFGLLPLPESVSDLASSISQKLELHSVRVVGPLNKIVKSIFMVSGSGMGYLEQAVSAKADVMITGDIRYHDALDAQFHQISLIDAGHFGLERCAIKLMKGRFETEFSKLGWKVKLYICETEQNPFTDMRF